MNYSRDPLEDARRIVLRDPGFAAWILVTELWLPLPRAIRWCKPCTPMPQRAASLRLWRGLPP
jgi:hypothetical protein